MKPFQIAILSIAFAIAGCQKPSIPATATKNEPTATPEPIAIAAPSTPAPTRTVSPDPEAIPAPTTPTPKATASIDLPPLPTPKQPEPEVVYFAVQRIPVMTNDGVYSILPGTQLRLVRSVGPTLIVTDGKNEFEAQPTQLTNDLEVAIRVAHLDAAAQRQLAADRAAKASQAQQQQPIQRAPTMEEMQQMVELAKKIQELRNLQKQQQLTPGQEAQETMQELDLIERLKAMQHRRR